MVLPSLDKIMKIKLVSDLHLEFTDINITNDENVDVLILGGDIMIAGDLYEHPETSYGMYSNINLADLGRRQAVALRFRDFLRRVSFQFPHVIYIAGNHEFYHFRWFQTLDVLRDECAKFSNIYFLENDIKKIDDVTFIGSTLWTDLNKGDPLTLHAVRDMMQDYNIIRNEKLGFTKLKPVDSALRHRRSVEYVQKIVEGKTDEKFVVVGHHAPTRLSIHEMYQSQHLTNGAYASDLSEFILDHPQIKLWTHGHTHHPFDYTIGETRIVCNPRGYEGYEPDNGWDPKKVIEI
jgi:predicted phosphodiesterase